MVRLWCPSTSAVVVMAPPALTSFWKWWNMSLVPFKLFKSRNNNQETIPVEGTDWVLINRIKNGYAAWHTSSLPYQLGKHANTSRPAAFSLLDSGDWMKSVQYVNTKASKTHRNATLTWINEQINAKWWGSVPSSPVDIHACHLQDLLAITKMAWQHQRWPEKLTFSVTFGPVTF